MNTPHILNLNNGVYKKNKKKNHMHQQNHKIKNESIDVEWPENDIAYMNIGSYREIIRI